MQVVPHEQCNSEKIIKNCECLLPVTITNQQGFFFKLTFRNSEINGHLQRHDDVYSNNCLKLVITNHRYAPNVEQLEGYLMIATAIKFSNKEQKHSDHSRNRTTSNACRTPE